MNIVLIGGVKKAKYLIEKFKTAKNRIVYITKDEKFGKYIDGEFNVDVYIGDGTNLMILESAEVKNFDLMIALCPRDEDNLVACRLGKAIGIKRTLSVINVPSNEEIFRELGVDSTISEARILGMIIEKSAFTENVESLLPIENGAIMLQIEVEKKFKIEGKTLREANLPKEAVVGCIIRDEDAVIPRGDIVIHEKDLLVIITLDHMRQKVVKAVTGS